MPDYFEIDKIQTEQINLNVAAHRCECSDCQWYYQYMQHLPASAKAFFEASGIEPVKCQELWAYFPNDNGFSHYSFYITQTWRTLEYGICSFRIRLEYTTDGKTILGFEASLPVENLTST